MKLFYTDPKKRRLQQIEILLFIILSPGLYFGYIGIDKWQRFSEAQELQQQASVAVHEGKLDEGLEKLEQAVKVYPEYPDAWEDLAVTYFLKQDHKKSLATYQKAIEHHPDNGDLHRNLAMAYHFVGDHQKELVHAEMANTMKTSDELFTLRIAERARWEANGKKGRITGTKPLKNGPVQGNAHAYGDGTEKKSPAKDSHDHQGHDHHDHDGHEHHKH